MTDAVEYLQAKGTFNVHLSPEAISLTLIVLLNILTVELADSQFEEIGLERRKSVEELAKNIKICRFFEDIFVEPYERHMTGNLAEEHRSETLCELEGLYAEQVRLNREAIAVLRKSIFFTDTLGLSYDGVKKGRSRMEVRKVVIRESLNFYTYYSGKIPTATEQPEGEIAKRTYAFLKAIFNELDLGEIFCAKAQSNVSHINEIRRSDEFEDQHKDALEKNRQYKGKDFPLLKIFQVSDRNILFPKT